MILRKENVYHLRIDISHDESKIATCGSDGVVKVWEVETGRELFALTGHRGYVLNVAFSPDSGLIASGSEQNETIVWKIAP